MERKGYGGRHLRQEINEKYPTLKDCVQYLRECGIDRPIYCGVGVHAPEDVKLVKEAGGSVIDCDYHECCILGNKARK